MIRTGNARIWQTEIIREEKRVYNCNFREGLRKTTMKSSPDHQITRLRPPKRDNVNTKRARFCGTSLLGNAINKGQLLLVSVRRVGKSLSIMNI